MKLYKYRNFNEPCFTFDIIKNEQLYSATYDNLNDPFEGVFFEMIRESGKIIETITPPITDTIMGSIYDSVNTKSTEVKNIVDCYDKYRITSLSSDLNETLMWSKYADDLRGIAIEIELDKKNLYKVEYLPKLPKYPTDKLPTAEEILSVKTIKWKYEAEYRLINSSDFFSITNQITSIYVGEKILPEHLEELKQITPKNVKLFWVKTSPDGVSIELGEEILR